MAECSRQPRNGLHAGGRVEDLAVKLAKAEAELADLKALVAETKSNRRTGTTGEVSIGVEL